MIETKLETAKKILITVSEFMCSCPPFVDEQYCHHCTKKYSCNDANAKLYREIREWLKN